MESDQILALTCKECDKSEHCKSPCIFVDRIAGKGRGRKESLTPPLPEEDKDYKQALIKMQDARASVKAITIKEVRDIHDINVRAVAAMIYAKISIKDIAYQLDKSERTIRRICGLK